MRIHLHTRVPNKIKFDNFYISVMTLKEQINPFEDIENVSNKTRVNLYLDLLDKKKGFSSNFQRIILKIKTICRTKSLKL